MKKLLGYIVKALADRVIERLRLDGLHIAALDIQPGDIIIVKSDKVMHQAGREQVMVQLEELFPQHLVVVLDALDLSLIRPKLRVSNNAR